MSRRPPSAKLVATRGKENELASQSQQPFPQLALVPASRTNLLQLINNCSKPIGGDLQCRRLCGWQEEVLQRIDTNKSYKRRNQIKKPQKYVEDDYQHNIDQLKKEAEFLESDDNDDPFPTEEDAARIHHRKAKFPTESDITNLLVRETRYFPSKTSMVELVQSKAAIAQSEYKRILMNSSAQLGELAKKTPNRPLYQQSMLHVRTKQRPSTSMPVANEPLLIKSIQVMAQEEQYHPIHTAAKIRRHRRKVKSVTETAVGSTNSTNLDEPTAGLIGNASVLQRSEYCSINAAAAIPTGVLVFRKYNQMIRGKKLRTHRTSAAEP